MTSWYYRPVILAQKARRRRADTGDSAYYALFEKQAWHFRTRAYHVLVRPWIIFFQEPMLISLVLYMSVCRPFLLLWVWCSSNSVCLRLRLSSVRSVPHRFHQGPRIQCRGFWLDAAPHSYRRRCGRRIGMPSHSSRITVQHRAYSHLVFYVL